MESTNVAPTSSTVLFAAVQAMFETLPGRERIELSRSVNSYLKSKYPESSVAGNEAAVPLYKRQVSALKEMNPMQKLMNAYQCHDLVLNLNSLVEHFNSQIDVLEQYQESECFADFFAQACSLGESISQKYNSVGDERLQLWQEAIEILCEGCIAQAFDETSTTTCNDCLKENVLQFLNELRDISSGDKIASCLNYLQYLVREDLYNNESSFTFSGFVLGNFIASGDIVVFRNTLQALFSFHDFMPLAELKDINPKLLNELIKKDTTT